MLPLKRTIRVYSQPVPVYSRAASNASVCCKVRNPYSRRQSNLNAGNSAHLNRTAQTMTTILKFSASLLIASALTGLAISTSTGQQQYNNSGVLSCKMAPSLGLIVGSYQRINCQYRLDRSGQLENYSGAITRIGLDLGFSAGGAMAWAVLSSAQLPVRGGLAGTYVGASGDITVGVGVGANVLFGGSNSSVALQPVSIEGQIGLNLALGVANLQLRPTY